MLRGLKNLKEMKRKVIISVPVQKYVIAVLFVILLVSSLIVLSIGGNAAGTESDGETVETKTAENTNGYTFDGMTGDFTFTGSADADYYTIWVYALNEEGEEADSYVAASSRLTGDDEISETVDISGLPFGDYHADLLAFQSDGNNSDPIVQEFIVAGKLSVPEFKYTQEGTSVTVTLYSGTMMTYNENELFGGIDINIYDENGEAVQTEKITETDLIASAMGPMTSYSCEKRLQ